MARLPTEIQLAIASELGWEPRLRVTARGAPRPDLEADGRAERARAAAVDAARRTAPLHRVIDRVIGGR